MCRHFPLVFAEQEIAWLMGILKPPAGDLHLGTSIPSALQGFLSAVRNRKRMDSGIHHVALSPTALGRCANDLCSGKAGICGAREWK